MLQITKLKFNDSRVDEESIHKTGKGSDRLTTDEEKKNESEYDKGKEGNDDML